MIQLRGHHFLCLLTYIGRGYSPAFIFNMDKIAANIRDGSALLRIVAGPDALCAPLQTEGHPCAAHCHTGRTLHRDALALAAVGTVLGRVLAAGDEIVFSGIEIAALRLHFKEKAKFRTACIGCEWHALCSEVASGGFQGVKL